MIVFLISGLWHGAAWTFVIWGGLNGLMQVIGDMLKGPREKALKSLGIRTDSLGQKLVRIFITFVLVDLTWVFFRAPDLAGAWSVLKSSFTVWNPWVLTDGTLYTLGLERIDFWILILSILILAGVDILHVRGVRIRETIAGWPLVIRRGLIYLLIFWILLFGIYGPAYDAASFIYFQF